MKTRYIPEAPPRAELDAMAGPVLLEFGANWCGHCMAAQSPLQQAFAGYDSVSHYKVEDGPGLPLGRAFRVKLWPTFIFLLDGEEKARVVRPLRSDDLSVGFAQIDP